MNQKPERIHFIAVGGSIMHSLAIALKMAGNDVSGSDDHFFDPSKSRLAAHGLLSPRKNEGWQPERITEDLDYVVLGMHAQKNNPELQKAQKLNLPVYSFAEFIYKASANKTRVVIAGSHGKTTITSMVMHVLRESGKNFDYLVAASLEGFDNMVKLSDAPVIVIEGDEYTTSALDLRPKFIHYQHHIGLISGIAWDHYNVFPSKEVYTDQFRQFIGQTPPGGFLTYAADDSLLGQVISEQSTPAFDLMPYQAHPYVVKKGKTYLTLPDGSELEVAIVGEHNMQNLKGAQNVLRQIGVTDKTFYDAMATFKGAAKRMEVLAQNKHSAMYLDFAHAPSKLKATASAIKAQFENRQLVACLELHTFSSLNKGFIDQYQNTFNAPDEAIIFIDPKVVERKGLPPLSEKELQKAFRRQNLKLFHEASALFDYLISQKWTHKNLLMMSSGNFAGLNLKKLKEKIYE